MLTLTLATGNGMRARRDELAQSGSSHLHAHLYSAGPGPHRWRIFFFVVVVVVVKVPRAALSSGPIVCSVSLRLVSQLICVNYSANPIIQRPNRRAPPARLECHWWQGGRWLVSRQIKLILPPSDRAEAPTSRRASARAVSPKFPRGARISRNRWRGQAVASGARECCKSASFAPVKSRVERAS